MSKKSLRKKNKILKLKVLSEDKEIAEEELQIGTMELTSLLQDFRKNIKVDQKNKYDAFFFGQNQSFKTPQASASNEIELSDLRSEVEKTTPSYAGAPWIKKLYKETVQRSHPDRYIDFPVQQIKEKYTKVYIDAVEAFQTGDVGVLILCAYEVEIEVKEKEADAYVDMSIKKYRERMQEISSLIGYQWYHIPDANRINFLENYLKSLGYIFEKEKAKDVVAKKLKKRKTGTRPEKIRVNRRKIN